MKQTSTPLTRWANSRRPELRMMGGGEYATTEANNATMTANLRDGVDPYRGMALAPPKSGGDEAAKSSGGDEAAKSSGGDEAAKSSGGVSGASMMGTGEFNIPMPQLRDGGELYMSTGGQHRGFLNVLEGAHDTLGDWANMAGDYLSPAGLLPQPRGLTAPASAHQGPGVMDRVAELAKPLMPMRGNSSQSERFRATPTSVPAAPAPTVQTQAQAAPADHMGVTHTPSAVTGTDRAAFLARNPAIAARYEAERNRGYNPNASPSTTAAPTQPSLHSQGVQQPWRTVLTQRTDPEGQAIHQKQYKQGNTYSDRPVAPAAPAPVQTASPTYSTLASARRVGQDTVGLRHGGELYMANGGVIDTLKGYFGGQKKVLDKRMAAAEAPQAPPPPPPPQQPVNPRVTPDNPAGIQFRDGGELYMTNGGGMLTTLRNYFGGQKKVLDKRMAAAEAPQAPPPPPPPQPVNPRATPENPAGIQFAHGGSTLRTGHGGVVPGTGTGDKIPAKYEPGEFVVSNDMLDAEPELRQHLRGLREEVLAEKGMTVAEADAKALNGGKGLRAAGAFELVPAGELEQLAGGASQYTATGGGQVPGTGGAVGAAPRDPYRYIGERVGKFAREIAPKAEVANRAVAALGAGYNAHNTMNAIDEGRTADAVDSGVLTGASALSALPTRAGWVGAAYGAGHALGKHVIYPNLSDDTKDTIGRTINAGLRHAGNVFGQEWGVDDTALRQEQGKTLSPGVNAGAAPVPTKAKAKAEDFTAANAAKLAAADKLEADINAPGKLGETRNFDRNGNLLDKGQEMVYTGPKMGWQQRTSEAHLAKLNADDLKWQADNDRDAAAARARTAETLKRFEMQELLAQPMSKHRRAQVTALLTAQMQNDAAIRGQDLTANTQLATTRMNNDTQLMGNRMTNTFSARKFQIEQANKDREYAAGRSDAAYTQKQGAEKAWDEHASKIFVDGENKPDAKRIAVYTQTTDATIGKMIPALLASKDPKQIEYAGKLSKYGRAALDDQDRADMLKHFQRMELARDSYGLSPFAADMPQTYDLRTFADKNMRAQPNNILQQRYEFLHPETGKPIGSIPAVNFEYGPDANHLWPNFGAPNNSLK